MHAWGRGVDVVNEVVKSGVAIVPLGSPRVFRPISRPDPVGWLRLDSSSLAAGTKGRLDFKRQDCLSSGPMILNRSSKIQ